METAIQTVEVQSQSAALSVKQVTDRVNLVHEILGKIMRDGCHYGRIENCGNKKVLFKPGADLLAMTFRLSPEYSVESLELGN